MTLSIDTSTLIALERNDPRVIRELHQLAQIHNDIACIPFMCQFEFLVGLRNKNPKNQQKARELMNQFLALQTTIRTAEILAELKEEDNHQASGLGLADMLIAAQAIEHGHVLVTRDRDFAKINRLQYVLI